MINRSFEDYESKRSQFLAMVEAYTRPLVKYYDVGFKGWLIQNGVATPIMHDWYIELERQIRGYIEHKKDQIFNS